MLDVYADVCARMLAMPVVKGVKSPSERFAGADETFTIEALMQNGWALQSGTSHFLGQNFARAFDVEFQDSEGGRSLVWATSWGVSTRLIGALIMTHSDDAGLVLPPAVAPIQVVVVPIMGKTPEDAASVNKAVDEAVASMKAAGVRVKVDHRENMRPGAKYFEWERKGVPLRLEVGPRDVAKGVGMVKSRLGGDKEEVELGEGLGEALTGRLTTFHEVLFKAAEDRLADNINPLELYDEMKAIFAEFDAAAGTSDEDVDEDGDGGGAGEGMGKLGMYLVPWYDDADNEDKIKEETRATIRCFPLAENGEGAVEGKTCFYSGKPATHMALFARAF
mmetsp:Transcript_77451/g.222691  ORF Transcript_77451/g.222691 Transcript_77451/m.222691 type:complete len:335 (+) Transcript_77451:2-1006(+)